MNLWDSLFAAAHEPSARLWVRSSSAQAESIGWGEVINEAELVADGLRRRGVARGDVVGAVLTNDPRAVAGLLGIWLAGAAVASLPVPARGMDLAAYTGQLGTLAESFSAPFLLTDGRFAPMLSEGMSGEVLAWEEVLGSRRLSGAPPEPDELAFVQYSSGSTSLPKGCMLSGTAIAAQLDLLRDMSGTEPGRETVAAWLPLSHDMGLFGCLLFAWAHSCSFVMSSPERFMQSPRTWLDDCATSAASLTAGTNLALRLAARVGRNARTLKPLNLRVCVVGAERVEPSTLREVSEVYGDAGLDARVLTPAYGLAEATLAVTATGLRDAPRVLAVDADELAERVVREVDPNDPHSALLVSCGSPCRGVSVRAGDPTALSEIYVRSPSLAHGYHNDPEQTRDRFLDGEFRTGDLGFVKDGQLFVVGRLDDMLQVGGRNVYAAEIESAMSRLPGVRPGCCLIVSVLGQTNPALVALAEVADGHVDFTGLAVDVAQVATRTAGITLDECLFLPKGTLPKTPSGKVQRYRAHRLARDESFEPLARVGLTAGSL